MKLIYLCLTLMLATACEGGGRTDATDADATPIDAQTDHSQQLFEHFNQYADNAS